MFNESEQSLETFLLFFNQELTEIIFDNHNKKCKPNDKIDFKRALTYYISLIVMIIAPQPTLEKYWQDHQTNLFGGDKVIPKDYIQI